MRWNVRAKAAARRGVEAFGLRVVCLVCGNPQRFYPGGKRLRETVCTWPTCGARALRSAYWIATHPELAREAATRARALERSLR